MLFPSQGQQKQQIFKRMYLSRQAIEIGLSAFYFIETDESPYVPNLIEHKCIYIKNRSRIKIKLKYRLSSSAEEIRYECI